MRILRSYIFKEMLGPFLISLGVIIFLSITTQLLRLGDVLFGKAFRLIDAFQGILFLIPTFLVFTIPISFLLAILLTLGRLASDNEFVAIHSAGISIMKLFIPILVFSVIMYLFTTLCASFLEPLGMKNLKRLLYEISKKNIIVSVREGSFSNHFKGVTIYASRVSSRTKTLKDVMIYDMRDPKGHVLISAKECQITPSDHTFSIDFYLKEGEGHINLANGKYRIFHFKRYIFRFSISDYLKYKTQSLELSQELSPLELYQYIRTWEKKENQKNRRFRMHLHKKLAFPFACIPFALFGIALGISRGASYRSRGFIMCLIIILLYYIVVRMTDTLWKKEILADWVAAWSTNVVALGIGLALFVLKGRRL